jgi:hypothetical protein
LGPPSTASLAKCTRLTNTTGVLLCPPGPPNAKDPLQSVAANTCKEARCTYQGSIGPDGYGNYVCTPVGASPAPQVASAPSAVTPLPPVTGLSSAVIPVGPPVVNSAPPLVATPQPAPLGPAHVNIYEPPKVEPRKAVCTATRTHIDKNSPHATGQMTVSVNEQCRRPMNWSDPTTTVTLAKAPSHGTVTIQGNSGYTYKPNPGFQGSDSFTLAARWRVANGTVTYNVTVK